MVFDSNSDNASSVDLFTKSLRDDLQKSFSKLLTAAPQSFVGVSDPAEATPDLFAAITSNICAVKPDVVFYAGRSVDLTSFIDALETRVCAQTPIVIATAGSNLGKIREQEAAMKAKGITMVYATLADATGWLAGAPGTPQHFADFATTFRKLGFPDADLSDGGAIATHDSVLVAARAVRLAAQAGSGRGLQPKAADVFNEVLNMNNQYVVPSASGDLSYYYRADDPAASSDPGGRPLPVIAIPAAPPWASPTPSIYMTQ
ncbi:hypothetical protein ACFQ9X_24860 [Catenulispora yoronensis]